MTRDIENATKSAQTAALLVSDLRALVQSGNPLLADIALAELAIVAPLQTRLERLQANLEQLVGNHG